MFEAKVIGTKGGKDIEIEVMQVHPDATSMKWLAANNLLWLVGAPAFKAGKPVADLGKEIGDFSKLFEDDAGNTFLKKYFAFETKIERDNYNDANRSKRLREAKLPVDSDLTRQVVYKICGRMRVKLTATDRRWAKHLTKGRSWEF